MTKIKIIAIIFFISTASSQSLIDKSRRNAITNSISNVSPAVASINVTQVQRFAVIPNQSSQWFNFFPQIRQREVKSSGSGVVISQDGYVITNNHVIENASKVIITLSGGKEYVANIIGNDKLTDLALLKLDGENFDYAKMGNSDNLIIGEWVVALGNPFGLFDINQQPTATIGIISAKNLDFGIQGGNIFQDMIQTDAAINSGNSGGPLVNSFGEVIAINTFIYTGNKGSKGSVGIGFAIPINRAIKIAKELRSEGKVFRGFNMGFRGQSINSRISRLYNLPNKGILIDQISPKSTADKSKLKLWDVIISVDSQNVFSMEEIYEIIALKDLRPGAKILLRIWRDGRYFNRYLTLEKS